MADNRDKLREINSALSALKTERQEWEPDWRSLSKLYLPRKYRNLEQDTDRTNKGMLREDILDGAGIAAARVLAAGMHGGMTSPARPWFNLTLADEDLAGHTPVRDWLDQVTVRMQNVFARSNFYQQIAGVYQELGVFGSNYMFIHPDDRTAIRFDSLTTGEYWMDCDEQGRVDTIYRQLDMTARNIVRMFGYEKCSSAVKSAYDVSSTLNKRFKVIHAVFPREERDPRKVDAQNKPWASIYFEKDATDMILRESGYDYFPGFGIRWDVTGQDVYGMSPAMDVLGDARMLQSIWFTYLKQLHKSVDPPVTGSAEYKDLNLDPNGFTPQNTTGTSNGLTAVYQVRPDSQGVMYVIQDIRNRLQVGMYNDLFRMLAMSPTRQMTATEVAERHEEKLLQLGPVLERLHDELFTPLIDRTFDIMVRNDMTPPPPEEIQGMPLKVEFVSLLAQAQKQVATTAVDRFTGFIAMHAQTWPEMVDALNADKAADSIARNLGVEEKLLNPQDVREQKRQVRTQMAQQAQAMEAASKMSQAAKTAADTPLGENTMLDQALGGPQ